MRFISKVKIALAAVALLPGALWATSFTASLDQSSITLGDSTTLSLVFEGASPSTVPSPSVPGLQISSAGTSQNFSYINGAMRQTVTVAFTVTPQQTGEFTIPAITTDMGGQQYATQPLKLIVTKAAAPTTEAVNSGNEVAFMKLVVPKQKFYAGECFTARLDLYFRDDVQNFGNLQLTSLATDGFSAGNATQLPNQRHQVQVGNRVYTVIPLAVPMAALKTGNLTMGPFTASCVVVLPGQNQGGDPVFRFFNQGEQKQMSLATESFNVQTLSLPDDKKPASFNGAIGSFSMNATAGPTTVTVGDPITVRVKISGHGSMDSLALPAQDAWQNFKTYPPTSKLETSDAFGQDGTKTFEQIISPLNTDVHELPPLYFSYFNPEDGQYHTLHSSALPLTVQPAGATPLPAQAVTKNGAAENQTPQDILPIKERLGNVAQASVPLVAKPVFLAAQSVPVLAFLAAFVWRQRTDSLANNPRLRRQRAVAQLIAVGKLDLKKYAAANQPDEFFVTLFRLLQEQLGERLDCPASAITENVLDGHTLLRNAPAATRDGLHELFQLCNQARYAPVRGTSELNSVAVQFERVINQLQELKA